MCDHVEQGSTKWLKPACERRPGCQRPGATFLCCQVSISSRVAETELLCSERNGDESQAFPYISISLSQTHARTDLYMV